jgi:hypothetical protein
MTASAQSKTILSIRFLPAIHKIIHQKGIPSRYFRIVRAVERAVGANWSASTSAIMCMAERCLKIQPDGNKYV